MASSLTQRARHAFAKALSKNMFSWAVAISVNLIAPLFWRGRIQNFDDIFMPSAFRAVILVIVSIAVVTFILPLDAMVNRRLDPRSSKRLIFLSAILVPLGIGLWFSTMDWFIYTERGSSVSELIIVGTERSKECDNVLLSSSRTGPMDARDVWEQCNYDNLTAWNDTKPVANRAAWLFALFVVIFALLLIRS